MLTNKAHLQICPITYYSSPTYFGHSGDHHQGIQQQEYNHYTSNCAEMYDKTSLFFCGIPHFLVVIKYQIILSLKYSKIGCIYVVCLMCIVDLYPV